MIERWRKPLVVLHTEPGNEIQLIGGQLRRSLKIVFDRESTERIRSGYACAKCLEVWEVPWPEHCPMCGAPIRERQLEYFEREYGGTEHLGPTVSLSDELERLREGDFRDE